MIRPRYSEIFAGHVDGTGMAERAAVLWEEYKADLVARGLWNPARARTLDRLIRATVEYEHWHPIAIAEGPVSVARNGNEFVNYLWSMVQKLSDQISKLEKSLLMTPESVGGAANFDGEEMPAAADEFLGKQRTH